MWSFTTSEAERSRRIREERKRRRWQRLKFWKRPAPKEFVPTLGQRLLSLRLSALGFFGLCCLMFWIHTLRRRTKHGKSKRLTSLAPILQAKSSTLSLSSTLIPTAKTNLAPSKFVPDHPRIMPDRVSAKLTFSSNPSKSIQRNLSGSSNSSQVIKLYPMLTPQEAYCHDLTQIANQLNKDEQPPSSRRNMERRCNMPITTTSKSAMTSPSPIRRRTESLERRKSIGSSGHSSTLHNRNLSGHSHKRNQRNTPPEEVVLDFAISDNGDLGSLLDDCGSVCTIGSTDFARLAQTIEQRRNQVESDDSKVDEIQIMQLQFLSAQRQGCRESTSKTSVGILDAGVATLERFLAARRGSLNSLANSTTSDPLRVHRALQMNRVDDQGSLMQFPSWNSVSSLDSSIIDAFYDPAADVPPFLTIYYATQSGTSEYYAYMLRQDGLAMGLDVGICNVENLFNSVDMSLNHDLAEILIPHVTRANTKRGRAVFLISTYQDGGPTADGVQFLKMLEELQGEKYLKGLRYAVFGFGNSTYSNTFNTQSIYYDRLLASSGAKRMVPLTLGDDSKDIDWDFEQWKWKVFWPKFADISARDYLPAPEACPESNEPIKKCHRVHETEGSESAYTLEYISDDDIPKQRERWDQVSLHPSARHFRQIVEYQIKSIRPLWRDPALSPSLHQPGSTMHLELDLNEPKGIPFRFKTGDSLSVSPMNMPSVVKALAKHLGFDLNATFILKSKQGYDDTEFELPFPTPCTVRDYLSKYCELTAPPRRSVVRTLSKCATDQTEREELHRLSSQKHRKDYMTKIVLDHVGLADLITNKYPSISLSLVRFIGLCAPMRTRLYTASSSTLMEPSSIHLTFNITTIIRPSNGTICQGCASHYMANLKPGNSLRVSLSSSSHFVVPLDHSKPVILIANGSGIAPMRALIQERHFQKANLNIPVGATELFFGIRRRDLDYLYQDEFVHYKNSGSLSALYLACSREQLHKIYVQHLVAKHAEHIWKLIKQGASIYVCGGSAMRTEVDQVLRTIISRKLGKTEADEFMNYLEADRRYVHEAFDANHVT